MAVCICLNRDLVVNGKPYTVALGTVHFLSGGGWWFLQGAARKDSDVKGGSPQENYILRGGHQNINEYIIYKNQSNKLS
jgi:hypothetical protein